LKTGVAVEKLTSGKCSEKLWRQDALQTTFSVRVDIFYPPNFGCFEKSGLFQQPQAFTLKTPWQGSMSAIAIYRQSS
jgi:hypothetical protein